MKNAEKSFHEPFQDAAPGGLFLRARRMLESAAMFVYPDISPIAFEIGPLQVHWYGIMYLISFVGGYWLLHYRARTRPRLSPLQPEQIGDLIFTEIFHPIAHAVATRCDACLRIGGPSAGADGMVELAR